MFYLSVGIIEPGAEDLVGERGVFPSLERAMSWAGLVRKQIWEDFPVSSDI